MRQLPGSMGEYDGSDALMMVQAFRAANDEDTRKTLNVFASKKQSDVTDWFFYAVSAKWMRKAWPFLSSQSAPSSENWRENIGIIENVDLLASENAEVSSSDEEERGLPGDSANSLVHDKKRYAMARPLLRRDLQHERDFFLLGANAWLLLKEKFGFDVEIKRRCVLHTRENPVAVEVHPAEDDLSATYIPIPAGGRFRYEDSLSTNVAVDQHKAAALAAAAAAQAKHLGNVSDDETAECGDDLFPGMDDDDRVPMDHTSSNERVLLLPDSLSSAKSDNYWTHSYDQVNDDDAVMGSAAGPVLKPYGSGLGNLGNTCFMNATLQCLAHTAPIRKYFLSGEYEKDLNRENPLGTGGELAVQFARLLGEMWGTSGSGGANSVVYPRNFKFTLGRHAEQFIGYDQHDAQELATYLLDALHEDTNRVTKKPYIEKHEQGENERDEEAAAKAWDLNRQRENSTILDYFMGQVKSRVQCCKESCNRVSTTFDPFMYLSVPIPGCSEKEIKVTFVPIDPNARPQEIRITINKTASIIDLKNKLVEQLKVLGLADGTGSLDAVDLCAVDVWQREIYGWYSENDEVDRIRENDDTFIYQLRPLKEIQSIEQSACTHVTDVEVSKAFKLHAETPMKFLLDPATLMRLNQLDDWKDELSKYLMTSVSFFSAFNPNRGRSEDRATWYNKLCNFIGLCYGTLGIDATGQRRKADGSFEDAPEMQTMPEEEEDTEITSRTTMSNTFAGVNKRHDVAVLEYLAKKMKAEILAMEKEKQESFPDGVVIQIRIRKYAPNSYSKERNLAAPFVVRIPSDMTVYAFREHLAKRLDRALKTSHNARAGEASGEGTSESQGAEVRASNSGWQSGAFGDESLLLLRQVPLTFERKGSSSYGRTSTGMSRKLGVIDRDDQSSDRTRPVSLASPTDSDEKASVARTVGDRGTVYLDWPEELADRSFDLNEYERVETPSANDDSESHGVRTRTASNAISVLECIEKYCQMEQLEESEMWYCNRCQEHVRAYKHIHLYRAPPILIVHLKRFQYSATTHRRDKINVFIDFPLEGLDLSDLVMHWTEEEKPIYDCYAVSNHFGGLGGGHYTAHALNNDGVWCHYDDSRITQDVDPKEVVSSSAYVLYYRRRDVPVGDDFMMHLTTPGASTPAIIHDSKSPGSVCDGSSSNAAMVDEDEHMDVDDPCLGSRSASPMGSTDEAEPFQRLPFGSAGTQSGELDDDDFPPLQ